MQKLYSAGDTLNDIGVYGNRRSKFCILAVERAKRKKTQARPRIPASGFKTRLFVVEGTLGNSKEKFYRTFQSSSNFNL